MCKRKAGTLPAPLPLPTAAPPLSPANRLTVPRTLIYVSTRHRIAHAKASTSAEPRCFENAPMQSGGR
eukprot:3937737-Rhodomonas_salina.1